MGAPRSHVQPSREQIHAAKLRLALAKKWESSTRDTLEIAWKQVELATRHLESAREQVNDAESNLKTTSSSDSRDGNSATVNNIHVEGGPLSPASRSKKKNLKGRAYALVAKSFRKGSGGGSRAGSVGDAAKKKMQADYEHRQQHQEGEESKEKYIIYDHHEGDEDESSDEDVTITKSSDSDDLATLTRKDDVHTPGSMNRTDSSNDNNGHKRRKQGDEKASLIRRSNTKGTHGSRRDHFEKSESKLERDRETKLERDKASFRRSNIKGTHGSSADNFEKSESKLDREERDRETKLERDKASFRRSNIKGGHGRSADHFEKSDLKLERGERDGETKVERKLEREDQNPESHLLNKSAQKLERDTRDKNIERKLDRDRKTERKSKRAVEEIKPYPPLEKRSSGSGNGSSRHLNHASKSKDELERSESNVLNASRSKDEPKKSSRQSSNRLERNESLSSRRITSPKSDSSKQHRKKRDRDKIDGDHGRRLTQSLMVTKPNTNRDDSAKQRRKERDSGKSDGGGGRERRLTQSLKVTRPKDRRDNYAKQSRKKQDSDKSDSDDDRRRRLTQSLKVTKPEDRRALPLQKAHSMMGMDAPAADDDMQRLVEEARNQIKTGDIVADGSDPPSRRKTKPDSHESLHNLSSLGPRSSTGDLFHSDVSTSSPILGLGTMAPDGHHRVIQRRKSVKVVPSAANEELYQSNVSDDTFVPPYEDSDDLSSDDESTTMGDRHLRRKRGDLDLSTKSMNTDGGYDLSTQDQSKSKRDLKKSMKASEKESRVQSQQSPVTKQHGNNNGGDTKTKGFQGSDQNLTVSHSKATERIRGKDALKGDKLSRSMKKLHDVIVPETDEDIPLQPETARK
eukprot:CAMPEP_0201664004 /NCGR_PEP_ID=MMETSP0494-20130426/5611_1 /ASSEMBLY_ACC=CAM_ASM_000839 /TAXON_ID=420259 /ORGANISM="Thalassiosira gravida, Strain GMp14c1" /LENGTH=857 /DNA_ID=CAMNT_0048142701 /DNA_START=86 /DNA_END=2659 /DNA_ORIENTATION=+